MSNMQTALTNDDSETAAVNLVAVVLAYVVAIIGVEVILVHVDVLLGYLGHLFLVPTLLINYGATRELDHWRVLPMLALVSLLRVFSLLLGLQEVPVLYWYIMISTPLAISVFLTIRLLGLSLNELRLSTPSTRAWIVQLPIALSGIPLSVIAYSLLHPDPLFDSWSAVTFAVGTVILTLSTGFLEEVIFRGLLQPSLIAIFGRVGYLIGSGLFAIMYLGTQSPEFILFIGLTGLFFAWCAERTRLLWGVVLAHSILNVGMLLVLPHY